MSSHKNKGREIGLISARIALLFVFFVGLHASAAVLPPGNVSSCGELAAPGTYTLTGNLTAVGTSSCFLVSSDNVTIDGAGYSVSGAGAWAIDARSYDGGNVTLKSGANGFTNLLVNELAVTGFAGGVNASGNSDPNGLGVNAGYGGAGGDVEILYSTVGSVYSNGGDTSNKPYGGAGGNIIFTSDDLNLSNSEISVLAGSGTAGRNTDGGLDLNYTGALSRSGLSLSPLSFFNDNLTAYGAYPGGTWPVAPGAISACGTLRGPGAFTLLQDVSGASGTCFTVASDDVTIDGAGHSVSSNSSSTQAFAVVAGSYSGLAIASTTFSSYPNMVISSSSVSIAGADLDLSGRFIAADSLSITYTGTLNRAGTVTTALSSLSVNGASYGAVSAGILLDWVARAQSTPWNSIASSADGTKLVAATQGVQIYTSVDSGVTWTVRGSSRNWTDITSSADGTRLAAVVSNGQIYTSTNSGATWVARDSSRAWSSIASSADGTRLVAVVTGGQIYTSTDSGVTWTARDSNRAWTGVTSSADGAKLAAVTYSGQIYTSTNSGATWTARDSSRTWISITSSADGTRLAAVVSGGQIYTSTDSGATWTARDSNRGWQSITSSADGTRLAAVVSGGQIYVSTDSGATWTARESSRGWSSIASSADGTRLVAANLNGNIYVHEDNPRTLSVDILNPQSITTQYAWFPIVSWGSASSCYYSYDNFTSTSTANCALGGSDITEPARGATSTLSVRGIDANGAIDQDQKTFSAAQIISACGQTINSAGEYYLTSNIAVSSGSLCLTVATEGVTIVGGGKTITGNILADNASGQGYSLILDGVTVTGNVSARGNLSNNYGTITFRNGSLVGSPAGSGIWGLYTFDGSLLSDSSGNGRNLTYFSGNTDPARTTLTKKFGAGAAQYFGSTGRSLETPTIDFGSLTGYTLEGWFYLTADQATGAAYPGTFLWAESTPGDGTVSVARPTATGRLEVGHSTPDGGASVVGTTAMTLNAWHHVATTWDGTTLRLFLDGNLEGSASASTIRNRQQPLTIGGLDPSNSSYTLGVTGYIDNFRITLNQALYTSSFALPGDYSLPSYNSTVANAIFNNSTNYSYVSGSSSFANGAVNGYSSTSTPINVSITRPGGGSTVTSWDPFVAWGTATSCFYSFNNWTSTSTATCFNSGSDISTPPASGLNTLYLRAFNASSTLATSSVAFTYLPVLSGGTISSCGTISSSGTYTLSGNIAGVTQGCFTVTADNVTIDGNGYTVTAAGGNTGYAVSAGSRQNLTLSNIAFVGFGSGWVSSTGSVAYSGTALDLTNSTTTAGSLSINYSGALTTLRTYISSLSSLIVKGVNMGAFSAGLFSWNTQDISACGTVSAPGYYSLTTDISSVAGTCLTVTSPYVIIDGAGHTISGTGGNANYAIVATHPQNAEGLSHIVIKDLTIVGFGGGIDARGADGQGEPGWPGGSIYLRNVHFPVNTVSANLKGGSGASGGTFAGGPGGSLVTSSSTLGEVILSGGDAGPLSFTVSDSYSGGAPGSLSNSGSSIATTTAVAGANYVPGCMNPAYDSYNPSATVDDGSCNDFEIGSGRDNPEGNTVSGPISFLGFSNRGIVDGDASYAGQTSLGEYRATQGNYGTTTGAATFDDQYAYQDGPNNYGYVGGGASFTGAYGNNYGTIDGDTLMGGESSTNFGTINGNVTFGIYGGNDTSGVINGNASFFYGANWGIINGDADFAIVGEYQGYNYGTVNGSATFWSNDDYYGYYNNGTVTGTTTYLYGCTDPAASNYNPNTLNDHGGCVYVGQNADNYGVATSTNGAINFQYGYSNYGTVVGEATFATGDGSNNFGTTTGTSTFWGWNSTDGTLSVDGSFDFQGTGVVGGLIFGSGANDNVPISSFEFIDGQVNQNITYGSSIFRDVSSNSGTIYGTTFFNNSSYNQGTINGGAIFDTTYYASTTPVGGTMYFEQGNWDGSVSGTVYGSDLDPITTYEFYGNAVNYGIIQGHAVFHDNSQNSGTVIGDASFRDSSFNSGTVVGNATYHNASAGILELSGSSLWGGTVTGSIKGDDGVDISSLVFNGSSANETTIASGISVTFNDAASNNGTILGDATFNNASPFRVGTVNGTATVVGGSQTITGFNSVLNFIKSVLSRDTLYLGSGSTLNVSGLFTLRGGDANNLLTVKSTVPGSFANIGVNGSAAFDFLRLKDINNAGAALDLVARTAYDDGNNSGFSFRPNTSSGTRSGLTSGASRPSNPVTRAAAIAQARTVAAPVRAAAGTTLALREFRKATALSLSTVSLPVNLVGRLPALAPIPVFGGTGKESFSFESPVSKFLLQPLPESLAQSISSYPRLSAYLVSAGVTNAQALVRLSVKPTAIGAAQADIPGVYSLSVGGKAVATQISSDGKGSLSQIASIAAGAALRVSVSSTGKDAITGSFNGQALSFDDLNSVSLAMPKVPGTYALTSSGSPLNLMIKVVDTRHAALTPTSTVVSVRPSLWERVKGFFLSAR